MFSLTYIFQSTIIIGLGVAILKIATKGDNENEV